MKSCPSTWLPTGGRFWLRLTKRYISVFQNLPRLSICDTVWGRAGLCVQMEGLSSPSRPNSACMQGRSAKTWEPQGTPGQNTPSSCSIIEPYVASDPTPHMAAWPLTQTCTSEEKTTAHSGASGVQWRTTWGRQRATVRLWGPLRPPSKAMWLMIHHLFAQQSGPQLLQL